jgi:hypothetical protein
MFETNLKILLIALLIICFSCEKKPNEFNKKLIEKISKENSALPSRYNSIILFIKSKENKVAKTNVQELKGLHKFEYNKMKFSDFLSDALNQKISIDCQGVNFFGLNKEVVHLYKNNDFNTFLSFYSEKVIGSNRLIFKNKVEENQINTVFYFLFLNNYLVSFDDISGMYFITPPAGASIR